MYDAIVVGARCAGSPTAMLLARKGYRVLLLDKAGFPSDTLSTHYIHQPGVARLARWGLLDAGRRLELPAGPHPAARPRPLRPGRAAPPPVDGIAEGYAPRRTILDQILVEAAVAAGAELREHFSVDELLTDGDRVTGIRGHAAGGAPVTEQARIVIGADGLHSLVARGVEAPVYDATPALTCAYYTYWSDVPIQGGELYPRPGRMIVAAPTNDGLTLAIVFWPQADFHARPRRHRGQLPGGAGPRARVSPSGCARGKRAERFRGTADLPNFFRQPYGPGWALVGDAGYHKDPILAQGITDAFRDAELLADALDAGFAGRQPAGGRARRLPAPARRGGGTDLRSPPCNSPSLQPSPPEMQHLLGALRHNQAQVDRFFGTIVGTVSAAEFFAPENLGQIMAAA